MESIRRIASQDLPTPTELAPDLPSAIDDFMARMLARDASARFQSAAEARAAFEHALDSRPEISAS